MKILHVVRGLANSSGTTHIVVPLAEELARRGCDVTVFHVQKGEQPAVVPASTLVKSHCFPTSLPLDNPGVSFQFAKAISSCVAAFDVVHIHAVWNFPTWYAMRAARKAAVPYVVSPQGSFEPWALRQNPWGKRVYGSLTEKPLLNRASCLQALTVTEAAQFVQEGISAPSEIIPNGVNESNFTNRATRLGDQLDLPKGQKVLLFLSRIHPKKGLELLIEAFARLTKRRADITLVIAGSDNGTGYAVHIERFIQQNNLQSHCQMIGEVSGDRKYETLLGADAFVLPSYSEGLPVAVVEAMAAGLPVVVTDRCNIPEIASVGAGWVVEPDVKQIASALVELFEDSSCSRHKGEMGKKLVHERFSWPRIAEQIQRVYERCVTEANRE